MRTNLPYTATSFVKVEVSMSGPRTRRYTPPASVQFARSRLMYTLNEVTYASEEEGSDDDDDLAWHPTASFSASSHDWEHTLAPLVCTPEILRGASRTISYHSTSSNAVVVVAGCEGIQLALVVCCRARVVRASHPNHEPSE
jgi:hypothetical protein